MTNQPNQKKEKSEVLVFGAFDTLHKGHLHLLREARALGTRLVVALAQDHTIKEQKGRLPIESFETRKNALLACEYVDTVHKGDRELGNYRVVSIERPDIIALGYDQDELKLDLARWMKRFSVPIPVVQLDAYHPELYKSSIIRNKSV